MKKIFFIQDSSKKQEEIINYLNIPSEDYLIFDGVSSLKRNEFNGKFLSLISEYNHPEVIITIGKNSFNMFFENKLLKKNYGKIFEKDDVFKKFLIVPLMSFGYFKYSKFLNPYKQLDNIKKYLMRYYGYGIIRDD